MMTLIVVFHSISRALVSSIDRITGTTAGIVIAIIRTIAIIQIVVLVLSTVQRYTNFGSVIAVRMN